jgi:hypothetical protein
MAEFASESSTVRGLFVGGVLENADPSLESLLAQHLDASGEGPGADRPSATGGLSAVLEQAQSDREPKVFELVGDGRPSASLVLEPIIGAKDAVIAVAVLTPELDAGEHWETLYTELAKAHQATVDFRQKLLAALPVLSGAGIGLLAANTGENKGLEPWLLIPLGLFGVLVAFGLYLYEARNIQECKVLLERGAVLERLAGAPTGQFMSRPPKLSLRKALGLGSPEGGWIDIEKASRVVYVTVILAWFGVAVGGLVGAIT